MSAPFASATLPLRNTDVTAYRCSAHVEMAVQPLGPPCLTLLINEDWSTVRELNYSDLVIIGGDGGRFRSQAQLCGITKSKATQDRRVALSAPG